LKELNYLLIVYEMTAPLCKAFKLASFVRFANRKKDGLILDLFAASEFVRWLARFFCERLA
jgi:hypothetical protein